MIPMMISGAKMKQVVTGHRPIMIIAICLVMLAALAVGVVFIVRAVHHHQNPTPLSTLTLTLTSFNNSTFSLLFSNPIHGLVNVIPEYMITSSFVPIIIGKLITFHPDGPQTVFSGPIPLPDLPPILQAQLSNGTIHIALHVNTILDQVVRGWVCFTLPTGICSVIHS